MSIADNWRRLGLGSALLQEIERKAAADGIELLFGDTLRTNEG
jgi:GNAT superfamily N-acetyltransferase